MRYPWIPTSQTKCRSSVPQQRIQFRRDAESSFKAFFLAMNIPTPCLQAQLTIHPHGHAPSKYGNFVYKFPIQAATLLKSRGWREVGHSRVYAYLTNNGDNDQKPPFTIDVRIPDRHQIETVAQELYRTGKEWSGRFGEWQAAFRPANNDELSYVTQRRDLFTGMPIGSPTKRTSPDFLDARFMVGCLGLWLIDIRWKNGALIFQEDIKHITTIEPSLFDPPSTIPTTVCNKDVFAKALWEGASIRVNENRYERNSAAREECIAYYGPQCCVCGFDFADTYGELARGLIHVHHRVPISSIGKEYQS